MRRGWSFAYALPADSIVWPCMAQRAAAVHHELGKPLGCFVQALGGRAQKLEIVAVFQGSSSSRSRMIWCALVVAELFPGGMRRRLIDGREDSVRFVLASISWRR